MNKEMIKSSFAQVKDKIGVKIARCKPAVAKALPSVMIFGGVFGVAAAAWRACSVTPEAKEAVSEFKAERDALEKSDISEGEKREQILDLYKKCGFTLVKLYARPVSVGVLSITMIFFGHGKLKKEITTLTATAASIDKMYQEYRGRVIEKYGEDADFNLRTGAKEVTVKETVTDEKGKEKKVDKKIKVAEDIMANSPYTRIYDETIAGCKDPDFIFFKLASVQDYYNRKLQAEGYVFLNDVLDTLGYKKCQEGQVVGWLYNPDDPTLHNEIDFGIKDFSRRGARDLKNGFETCIWLDFNVDGVIYNRLPIFGDSLIKH